MLKGNKALKGKGKTKSNAKQKQPYSTRQLQCSSHILTLLCIGILQGKSYITNILHSTTRCGRRVTSGNW